MSLTERMETEKRRDLGLALLLLKEVASLELGVGVTGDLTIGSQV